MYPGGNRVGIITHFPAVVFKHALPLDLKHAKYPFLNDILVHFGSAEFAVYKSYRDFYHFKAQLPSGKLHLDLESLSHEIYFIKIDRFQYFFPVAHKACSGVIHRHPGNEAGI